MSSGNTAIDRRLSAIQGAWPMVRDRIAAGVPRSDWAVFREEVVDELTTKGFRETPLRGRGIYRWAEKMVAHARAGHAEAPGLAP